GPSDTQPLRSLVVRMHSPGRGGARSMRNTLLAILAALSLMTSGMAATETQQAAQNHTDTSMMQSCPMKVRGTDLSIPDGENGVALTLATKSGEVAELRRRVENMAKMHSASSNAAMHGNMKPFSVKYEEVPYGARVTPHAHAQRPCRTRRISADRSSACRANEERRLLDDAGHDARNDGRDEES